MEEKIVMMTNEIERLVHLHETEVKKASEMEEKVVMLTNEIERLRF